MSVMDGQHRPSISSNDSSSFDDFGSDDSHLDVNYNEPEDVSSESDVSTQNVIANNKITTTTKSRGKKRQRNPEKWSRSIKQKLRNSGKQYEMWNKNKKIRSKRCVKVPCTEKCRLKCFNKFSEVDRLNIFSTYWSLSNIEKQRQFILNSMTVNEPRYRYVREGGIRPARQKNMKYILKNVEEPIQVCKLFFMNTLDINSRNIRTVIEKKNKVANILMEDDQRGKHGKHIKVKPEIRAGIKSFIESIPKIESHYTRANTTKVFIDGSKTVASLHKDYIDLCREKNVEYSNYALFYRIFNSEFNISFFIPKKDQCELCFAYENAEQENKAELKKKYEEHISEKELSRIEKSSDKEASPPDTIVAVYDMQAVLQLPKGDVSVFYYKCKLNVMNFTIFNLIDNNCDCFVWDESCANRGANELGTCVLRFMKEKSAKEEIKHFIFYSDNCAGQQKNKFMLSVYLYAVRYLNIETITHKYLIKGHTQNEGDGVHSVIERSVKRHLRSGPIYTPETFISIIKTAKKNGNPYKVNEMCFDDFYYIKQLQTDIGPLNMKNVKINDIKVLKVSKETPNMLFYKTSYSNENFENVIILKTKISYKQIHFVQAFSAKPGISERKKNDLMELIQKGLIPKYYNTFYDNL